MISGYLASTDIDDALRRKISAALDAENRNYLHRLTIDVENGKVILEGIVGSYHEKQLALSCLRKVAPTAKIIDNTLVIPRARQPLLMPPQAPIDAKRPQEALNK